MIKWEKADVNSLRARVGPWNVGYVYGSWGCPTVRWHAGSRLPGAEGKNSGGVNVYESEQEAKDAVEEAIRYWAARFNEGLDCDEAPSAIE
jgi:hypothetical protein